MQLRQQNQEITSPVEQRPSCLARLGALLQTPEAGTAAGRRTIYSSFEADFTSMLSLRGLSAEAIEAEARRLRQLIRALEKDVRGGIDVTAPDYRPGGYEAIAMPAWPAEPVAVAAEPEFLEPEPEPALPEPMPEPEEAELSADTQFVEPLEPAAVVDEPEPAVVSPVREKAERLHALMGHLQAPPKAAVPSTLGVLRALLIHQFDTIAGESRVALLWMMVQPAILLALISTMYFIAGTSHILNMDVPTFALLGAGVWIMCRQVIFRVSNQLAHNHTLANMPGVTPLLQAVTQSIFYFMVYAVSITLLLGAGRFLDMTTLPVGVTSLPAHPLQVVMYATGILAFAFSLGIIFGVIAMAWPYFLRFAPVLERALQIFSSVYFVSEQMPEQYKGLFLWCPTAHGFQLMRGAYFDGYPNSDASALYFWGFITVLTTASLFLERAVRRHVHPL